MFRDISYLDLRRWADRLFWAASLLLVAVCGAYAARFFAGFSLSTDPAVWGQFGDYVGGVTNPILAFLSFAALLLTLVLQGRQMEHASQELDLSRQELRRAAQAQERAEKDRARQAEAALQTARLNSINLLLDNYRRELAGMQNVQYASSDPANERRRFLLLRERELVGVLEQTYDLLLQRSN